MLMAARRPGGICGCVRGSLAARADIAQELHPAPGVRVCAWQKDVSGEPTYCWHAPIQCKGAIFLRKPCLP